VFFSSLLNIATEVPFWASSIQARFFRIYSRLAISMKVYVVNKVLHLVVDEVVFEESFHFILILQIQNVIELYGSLGLFLLISNQDGIHGLFTQSFAYSFSHFGQLVETILISNIVHKDETPHLSVIYIQYMLPGLGHWALQKVYIVQPELI